MDTSEKIAFANRLLAASHNFNIWESRLLLEIMSRFDNRDPLAASAQEVTITAAEFSRWFPNSVDHARRMLEKAASNLMRRVLITDRDRFSSDYEEIALLQWARYERGQSRVRVRVTPVLLEHLTELSSNFTMFDVSDVVSLKGKHALRLYPLLMQWKDKKPMRYTIGEMRTLLGIADGKYERGADMKGAVVVPACAEITEKSPYVVTVETEKDGRSIGWFTFSLKAKQPKLPLDKGGKKSPPSGGAAPGGAKSGPAGPSGSSSSARSRASCEPDPIGSRPRGLAPVGAFIKLRAAMERPPG